MTQRIEQLGRVAFSTAVLDEAQATRAARCLGYTALQIGSPSGASEPPAPAVGGAIAPAAPVGLSAACRFNAITMPRSMPNADQEIITSHDERCIDARRRARRDLAWALASTRRCRPRHSSEPAACHPPISEVSV
jgi:hypothetical protein